MKETREAWRPPVMRLCLRCAGTMNANRPGTVTLLGEEELTDCSWCGGRGPGGRWELWPETRTRFARRAGGGGERARAGRA